MTGGEALLRTLADAGVEVVFMNPGTSEMHFVSALDREPRVRGVLCLQEGVASGAADGYARMTHRPAATLLHLGPGLANGLSNFHNARKARSPVISIVGEHATRHLAYDAPLSADIAAFAKTVTFDVFRPETAGVLGETAARALETARQHPGRIAMLIVPADFSWTQGIAPGAAARPVEAPVPPVAAAAATLAGAVRPGLLLGGRATLDEGLRAASRFSAAGWRVFIDRNAPRVAGGNSRFQPERMAYFPGPAQAQLHGLSHLVLVEAKPPVSFFGYPDEASFLADPNTVLLTLAEREQNGAAALAALGDALGLPEIVFWPPAALPAPSPGPLTLESLGYLLAERLPDDAILSDEMVSSGPPVLEQLRRAKRFDYMPVTGGSIGQALPVAVGAAVACPGRRVVALEGDGSGMYTPQALWTMARERLDVTVIIFANQRYRILDVEMRRTGAPGFGPRANDMVDLTRPRIDWVALAASMQVPARVAQTGAEFAEALDEAFATPGPRLIAAELP